MTNIKGETIMSKAAEKIDVKIEDGMIVVEPVSVPMIFSDEKNIRTIIGMIKAEVDKHEVDLTTSKGRDAVKSLAYTVVRSKTTLDNLGKNLVADLKAKVGAVDAIRKIARDDLDVLRDEVKAPLEAWEKAEEDRIIKITSMMSGLTSLQNIPVRTSEHAISIRHDVEAMLITDDFEEFQEKAAELKLQTLLSLDEKIAELKKSEADLAELDQLRKEKEEREVAERLVAAEAAEKLRKEKADKERLEREEHIRKEEKERLEREHQEALDRAEIEKQAAVQQERERIEREQKIADSNKAAEEEQKRRDEEKKRLADQKKADGKRHQARINREAKASIEKVINSSLEQGGVTNGELSEMIIKAIVKGEISNVTINY